MTYFSLFQEWSNTGRKLTTWVVILSHLYSSFWSTSVWAGHQKEILRIEDSVESDTTPSPKSQAPVINTDDFSKEALLAKINAPLNENLSFGVSQLPTLTVTCEQADTPNHYVLKLLSQERNARSTYWEKTFDLAESYKLGPIKLRDPHRNARFGFTFSYDSLTITDAPSNFNYCFNIAMTLRFQHLSTMGYVDVQQAEEIFNHELIRADDGVRLHARKRIFNRQTEGRPQPKIISSRRVVLKSNHFNNSGGKVISPVTYGWFEDNGFSHPGLFNHNGLIAGTQLLHICTADFRGESTGTVRAPFGMVALHTKSYKPTGQDALEANAFIFNGDHLSLKGLTQVRQTLLADIKSSFDYNTESLRTKGVIKLTFHKGQSFKTPIDTASHLEINFKETATQPLHLLADIKTGKGITLHVPTQPVLVGSENGPLVKVHTKGALNSYSKTFDNVHGGVWSEKDFTIRTQDKIHNGRGTVIKKPALHTFLYTGARDHVNAMRYYLTIQELTNDYLPSLPRGAGAQFMQALVAWHNNHTSVTLDNFSLVNIDTDFIVPDGSYIKTEGAMTLEGPQEILNDSGTITVKGDWTAISNKPIHNNGGLITIKGNACIQSALKNTLEVGINMRPRSTLTYAKNRPGEIHIEGDLTGVKKIELEGSLLHVGGQVPSDVILERKPFRPSVKVGGLYAEAPANQWLQDNFSSAAAIRLNNIKDITFTGFTQASRIEIGLEGTMVVGERRNVPRGLTPPFQPIVNFIDSLRPSSFFESNPDSTAPYWRNPSVPLTWDTPLAPAVVMTSTGLRLLNPHEKLYYHPLEEIDALPSVFAKQLQRGYLDAELNKALQAYVHGRDMAYQLYLKMGGQPLLEDNNAAPQSVSKELSVALQSLSEEERKAYKFMVLYYGAEAEGKQAYLPRSWLSAQHYDKPRLRNPDGGVFADILVIKGLTPDATLHNLAHIHGGELSHYEGLTIINEMQQNRWLEIYINTYKNRKKERTETVAIERIEPIPHTGQMTSNETGQMVYKNSSLALVNGGQVHGGKQPMLLDLHKVTSNPAIRTSVRSLTTSDKRSHVTHHFAQHEIIPAAITNRGPIQGTIGELTFDGTHMIAYNEDITLGIKRDLLLFAHKETHSLGKHAIKNGVMEMLQDIAMPSALMAMNGNIFLTVDGRSFLEATRIKAKGHGHGFTLNGKRGFTYADLHLTTQTISHSQSKGGPMGGARSSQSVTVSRQSLGGELDVDRAGVVSLEDRSITLINTSSNAARNILKSTDEPAQLLLGTNTSHTTSSKSSAGTLVNKMIQRQEYHQTYAVPTITGTIELSDQGAVIQSVRGQTLPYYNQIQQGAYPVTLDEVDEIHTITSKTTRTPGQGLTALVALGATVATIQFGWGAALVKAWGLSTVTGAMLTAGISTLSSQTAVGLLSNKGDIGKALENLTKKDNLRSLGISVATAGITKGICNQIGLKELTPQAIKAMTTEQLITHHLQYNAISSSVSAALNMTVGQQDSGEMLHGGLKSVLVNTAAAVAAIEIGNMYSDADHPISYVEHKLAHGVLGGITGAILGDDPLKGVASGATGAVVAEMLMEAMAPTYNDFKMQAIHDGFTVSDQKMREMYEQELRSLKAVTTLASASSGLMFGDVNVAFNTADNAVENNAMPSFMATAAMPLMGTTAGLASGVALSPAIVTGAGVILIGGCLVYIGLEGYNYFANRDSTNAFQEHPDRLIPDVEVFPDHSGIVKPFMEGFQPSDHVQRPNILSTPLNPVQLWQDRGLTISTHYPAFNEGFQAWQGGNPLSILLNDNTADTKLLPAPKHTSYAGGYIRSFVTEKDQKYYRVCDQEGRGRFLTQIPPSTRALAREGLALPETNSAQYLQEVFVPEGTRLVRSRALPAFERRGGMEQFELLKKLPLENYKIIKEMK